MGAACASRRFSCHDGSLQLPSNSCDMSAYTGGSAEHAATARDTDDIACSKWCVEPFPRATRRFCCRQRYGDAFDHDRNTCRYADGGGNLEVRRNNNTSAQKPGQVCGFTLWPMGPCGVLSPVGRLQRGVACGTIAAWCGDGSFVQKSALEFHRCG